MRKALRRSSLIISPCHSTNSPSHLVSVAAQKTRGQGSGRREDTPQRRVIKGYGALGKKPRLSAQWSLLRGKSPNRHHTYPGFCVRVCLWVVGIKALCMNVHASANMSANQKKWERNEWEKESNNTAGTCLIKFHNRTGLCFFIILLFIMSFFKHLQCVCPS